jgi:hypothetical protein
MKNRKRTLKEAEGSEEGEDIDHRRAEVIPVGGKEVIRKGGHGNDKALKPHAHVDETGEDPDEPEVAPAPF